MELLKTYSSYKKDEPEYLVWRESIASKSLKRNNFSHANLQDIKTQEENKEKAKILSRALNLVDEYAQTKAEDVEAISQTVQIQAVGLFSWLGYKFGDWYVNKTDAGKRVVHALEKNLGRLKSVSKGIIPTLTASFGGVIAFIPVVIYTVREQVRYTRMARFEGLNKEVGHVNDFAILTEEQKNQAKLAAKNIVEPKEAKENQFNIFAILKTAKDLYLGKENYLKAKADFDFIVEKSKLDVKDNVPEKTIERAKKDQYIVNKILEKVEHDSQEPLRKIETIVNIGYSSLFVGGYLEYLLSDKLVEIMKIKNPVLKPLLRFGVPVVTYLLLNKQLAEFHNKAIKSIKYTKMQELINESQDDDTKSDDKKEDEKQGSLEFILQLLKNMKDYEKYRDSEFLEQKKQMQAARGFKLSNEQLLDAKNLRRSAFLAFNKHDDKTQKYMEMIEAITEIIVVANDIFASALGIATGWMVHKLVKAPERHERIYKGIGSILAFVPMVWTQIYATKEQRRAVSVAQMQTIKELGDLKYFTDSEKEPAFAGLESRKVGFDERGLFAQ